MPTPVLGPGEFHGLYSPWGRKQCDSTECVWLLWVLVAVQVLSLVVGTRGYSFIAVHGLFIEVVSLMEHRL